MVGLFGTRPVCTCLLSQVPDGQVKQGECLVPSGRVGNCPVKTKLFRVRLTVREFYNFFLGNISRNCSCRKFIGKPFSGLKINVEGRKRIHSFGF